MGGGDDGASDARHGRGSVSSVVSDATGGGGGVDSTAATPKAPLHDRPESGSESEGEGARGGGGGGGGGAGAASAGRAVEAARAARLRARLGRDATLEELQARAARVAMRAHVDMHSRVCARMSICVFVCARACRYAFPCVRVRVDMHSRVWSYANFSNKPRACRYAFAYAGRGAHPDPQSTFLRALEYARPALARAAPAGGAAGVVGPARRVPVSPLFEGGGDAGMHNRMGGGDGGGGRGPPDLRDDHKLTFYGCGGARPLVIRVSRMERPLNICISTSARRYAYHALIRHMDFPYDARTRHTHMSMRAGTIARR